MLTIVLAIAVLVIFRQINGGKQLVLHELQGLTMGTIIYNVKYMAFEEVNYQDEVDSLLVAFNQSLSTYIPSSELSQFNLNDSITFKTSLLPDILHKSRIIFNKSGGAYDPTIGPLVNAWGFGPKKKAMLDSAIVDSLLRVVGFQRIEFDQNGASKPANTYLDFSASAKGYALDVIADFFASKNVLDYMIEIGGEVRCQGANQNATKWKIGIEKPSMNETQGDLFATAFLIDRSLATSGNYRNYYQDGDQIIAHTISPFTGYSVAHNLLSASIFAPNCALADGYATACMVMGLEKSIDMVEKLNGIDGLFIFSKEDGTLGHYVTNGVETQLEVL